MLGTAENLVTERDVFWMHHALALAARARDAGEVPVGAVIVVDDTLISEGWNQPIGLADPTAHAEIVAIRAAACHVQNYRLPPKSTLYVTLEPCPMCAGAILHARISRVVFGAMDPKGGCVGSVMNLFEEKRFNHRVSWFSDVLASSSAALLQSFFAARRR